MKYKWYSNFIRNITDLWKIFSKQTLRFNNYMFTVILKVVEMTLLKYLTKSENNAYGDK